MSAQIAQVRGGQTVSRSRVSSYRSVINVLTHNSLTYSYLFRALRCSVEVGRL